MPIGIRHSTYHQNVRMYDYIHHATADSFSVRPCLNICSAKESNAM